MPLIQSGQQVELLALRLRRDPFGPVHFTNLKQMSKSPAHYRASLDDEMILLHAATNGKAHYRHPDAKLYEGQLAQLMSSLRGKSFGAGADAVVRRRDGKEPEARPLVVGRDV